MAKPPEPKPANIEEQERFILLRAQGKSYTAIAEAMGIGRGKALELGRKFRLEVGLEAALFRQVIRQQYKVAAVHRTAAYSEVLSAAFNELMKRVRGEGLEGLKLPELFALAQQLESRLLAEERPAQLSQGWQDAVAGDGMGEFLDMA